jgi:hypothetical protein
MPYRLCKWLREHSARIRKFFLSPNPFGSALRRLPGAGCVPDGWRGVYDRFCGVPVCRVRLCLSARLRSILSDSRRGSFASVRRVR